MNQRAQQTIDFVVPGIGGEKHTFSLIPLKKKTATQIFHNILLSLIDGIAGLVNEEATDTEILECIVRGLKGLSFDQFWYIAERLFKFAVVDDIETKKLEDAPWHTANDPTILYRAVFEGLKGNFPEVFSRLGLDVMLLGKTQEKKEKEPGDTPDQK